MRVRPLRDWLVLQLEPLPKTSPGGIILEGTTQVERQRVGKVLRVGPGNRRWSDTLEREIVEPVGIEVGDRVAFFREHLEHQQGKALLKQLEDDTGMIRAMDVLYVLPKEGA
jgi:co-chaperonin GroES (HSP10)